MTSEIISPKAVKAVLRDYIGEYRKHPWRAAVAFLLPAVGSILVFFAPPLVVARLIDLFSSRGISVDEALPYVGLMGGLWLAGEMCWRLGMSFVIKIETTGMGNLAKSGFQKLMERDYDFYTNSFVGSLTRKAFSYSRSFEMFTQTIVYNILSNIFPIIFAVIVLWQYSPLIPMLLLFWIGVVIILVLPLIRRRSRLVAERHDASSKLSGRLSDALTNSLAIKSFAKEEAEADAYGKYVDDFTRKLKRTNDYQNQRIELTISPLYVLTNVLGLTAAIYFAGSLGLTAGTIFIVFSYFSQITRIFWEFNHIYRSIESSVGEAAEFTHLFVDAPAVMDAQEAKRLDVAAGAIRFNDVTFAYEARKDTGAPFLKNFSLDIKSGEKVGLVGPSGGGKTTITKLLLRFLDVGSGEITIDDQNISHVTQASLREHIAYVPQEPLLFHRSLFENIAYADTDATEDEVSKAARLAHAYEFIKELPQGYETLVGERGVKLSGGQRQRVAIARAILKRAPILVLDEATSSLDSESERYIQDGLHELMKGKTALVIAHRLSTLKNLDRIIVLDRGMIVEDGTHNELIQKKGLYAKLWSHQSGEFLTTAEEVREEEVDSEEAFDPD